MKPQTTGGRKAPSRFAQRYGKLVRGWDWRTTPERLSQAESLAAKLGVSKTELLEIALDSLIEKHGWEVDYGLN